MPIGLGGVASSMPWILQHSDWRSRVTTILVPLVLIAFAGCDDTGKRRLSRAERARIERLEAESRFWSEQREKTIVRGTLYPNLEMPLGNDPHRCYLQNGRVIGGGGDLDDQTSVVLMLHSCPAGTGDHVFSGTVSIKIDGEIGVDLTVTGLGSLEHNSYEMPRVSEDVLEKLRQLAPSDAVVTRERFESLLADCIRAPDKAGPRIELALVMLQAVTRSGTEEERPRNRNKRT